MKEETLNKRIKNIRKKKKLTQKDFATNMGVSQGTISWSEQDGNNVPDSTIKSICTIFGANENYIRYGNLPMFIEPDTFSLDKFVAEHGGTELELEIIKTYFELGPEIRRKIFEHFRHKFSPTIEDMYAAAPDDPSELESDIDNNNVG